jgi:hypothetical protein
VPLAGRWRQWLRFRTAAFGPSQSRAGRGAAVHGAAASKTMPRFIKENQHLVVSLLFLDFDLYEPTKVALTNFVPGMPKGAIIAFDERDNPIWPGETAALLDTVGMNRLRIERLQFDPYIGFAVVE